MCCWFIVVCGWCCAWLVLCVVGSCWGCCVWLVRVVRPRASLSSMASTYILEGDPWHGVTARLPSRQVCVDDVKIVRPYLQSVILRFNR